MDNAIEVRNLSKRYIINRQGGYLTLRDALEGAIRNPFRKIAKIRNYKFKKEDFWALKNINFSVNKGEAVGIIGANGAGKSTLLKILSRITTPTTGEMNINVKISALLEVGTGFHQELSGRENIFLNGAILGMTKNEILSKFDDIVKFSGVEKFIDTPVKRYSTGMAMRLAFAVAAHLDPDIMLVDEVLAVGDTAFQKKCLGKIDEMTKKAGRTVIFVSHNLGAVASLCQKGIVLKEGEMVFYGDINEAIGIYTEQVLGSQKEWQGDEGDDNVKLMKTWVKSRDAEGYFDTACDIEVGVEANILKPIRDLVLGFWLLSEYGYELAYKVYNDSEYGKFDVIEPGKLIKKFVIPGNTLAAGSYMVMFDVGIHNMKICVSRNVGTLSFSLENTRGIGRNYFINRKMRGINSLFRPDWKVE